MKEILDDLDRWSAEGVKSAVALVVGLEGSAPRQLGSAMAVADGGEVVGSVSGGCVEGAAVLEALDVIAGGPRRVVEFGYSGDDAFSLGLTCGGTIRVFIEPFDWGPVHTSLRSDLLADRPVVMATVVDGPHTGAKLLLRADSAAEPTADRPSRAAVGTAVGTAVGSDHGLTDAGISTTGSLGADGLDSAVTRDALAWLRLSRSGIRRYGVNGEARQHEVSVFVHSFSAPPQMLVFGAVDFTAALARTAKLIGYRVTVCDARGLFATQRRFPMADEVVVSWPQHLLESVGGGLGADDAVCVLTHDPKFDVPAIIAALRTGVGYIGVMGSRRTHNDRTARLIEAGVDEAGLERLRSPIGLDIGAVTPEETAVSIMAEIIAERTGRDVKPLSLTSGPIHG